MQEVERKKTSLFTLLYQGAKELSRNTKGELEEKREKRKKRKMERRNRRVNR